jgi:hypothetical protein
VVGLLGMVVVSGLRNLGPGEACRAGFEFSKLLVYYLVLVTVVNTERKLRAFVYWLGLLILLLTLLALLQYHGLIQNAALAAYAEKQWDTIDQETGNSGAVLVRLCGAGLFANPNDLSRILVVGSLIALYGANDPRSPLPRLVWHVQLGIFGYALILTHSRGGFLALLTAMMVFLGSRFGGRKPLGLALVVLPLLFVVFKGRQTNISMSDGTGHQRVTIWRDGLQLWRERPLVGIGMGQYSEELGIAAHNSFFNCYAELGFLGGTLFLGAFYLAVLLLSRLSKQGTELPEGELRRFRPYLMGIIAGYMMGMTSDNRSYVPPTYMLLGLASIHVQLAGAYLPSAVTSLNGRLVRRVVFVSGLSVVALYLFIRITLAGS